MTEPVSVSVTRASCHYVLRTHSNELAGRYADQDSQEVGNQRLQIRIAISLRDEYDHRDVESVDFLLKRQITISGQKHIELGLCQREEFAVLLARPSHLGHGLGLMSDQ